MWNLCGTRRWNIQYEKYVQLKKVYHHISRRVSCSSAASLSSIRLSLSFSSWLLPFLIFPGLFIYFILLLLFIISLLFFSFLFSFSFHFLIVSYMILFSVFFVILFFSHPPSSYFIYPSSFYSFLFKSFIVAQPTWKCLYLITLQKSGCSDQGHLHTYKDKARAVVQDRERDPECKCNRVYSVIHNHSDSHYGTEYFKRFSNIYIL